MNPFISVIVPVYKVEAFLPRCINSLLNQTFKKFELILIDDGSPDRCGLICDEYVEKDDRIKVIHQENKKVGGARNAGLNIAQGEWIAFIDPDDWVHKDFLKVLASGANGVTDIVICDCIVTDKESLEDAVFQSVDFKDLDLNSIEKNRFIQSRVWGRLYKKETLGEARFVPGTEPTEDSCFNVLLFNQDMVFRTTTAKLYYYYVRPESAIHSHMGRHTLNAVEPMLDQLKNVMDEAKRKRIIERCYKYVWSARYSEMFASDFDMVNQKCKKLLRQIGQYRNELNWKSRVMCETLSRCPFLYRCFRIMNDPSLLADEKRKRNG